jgi:hypothetical protein
MSWEGEREVVEFVLDGKDISHEHVSGPPFFLLLFSKTPPTTNPVSCVVDRWFFRCLIGTEGKVAPSHYFESNRKHPSKMSNDA